MSERQRCDYLRDTRNFNLQNLLKSYKLINYTMITRIISLVYKTVSPHSIVYHLITYVSMVPHISERSTSIVGHNAHFFYGKIFYFSLFSILFGNDISTMQIMVELSLQFSNLLNLVFGTGGI